MAPHLLDIRVELVEVILERLVSDVEHIVRQRLEALVRHDKVGVHLGDRRGEGASF